MVGKLLPRVLLLLGLPGPLLLLELDPLPQLTSRRRISENLAPTFGQILAAAGLCVLRGPLPFVRDRNVLEAENSAIASGLKSKHKFVQPTKDEKGSQEVSHLILNKDHL